MSAIPADTSFLTSPHYARTRELIHDLDEALQKNRVGNRQRVDNALDWMLRAHYRQADREDGPYVNHPLTVALHVLEVFEQRDADLVSAALLHDTVEDQADAVLVLADVSAAAEPAVSAVSAVADHFGERVAALVDSLTNPDFEALQQRYRADGRSVSRNQLYHDHVARLYEQNAHAFVVKLADLWQNTTHLHAISDPQQQEHLRQKYGPVLSTIIDRLAHLDDPAHPLYGQQDEIVPELTAIYEMIC